MIKEIKRESCDRVGPGQFAYGDAYSGDGRVYVRVPDPSPGYALLFEKDGTYSKIELKNREQPSRLLRLDDGKYIGFCPENLARDRIDPTKGPVPFTLGIARADSFDDVVAGRIAFERTDVDIPGLAVGYGDSGGHEDWFAGTVFDGAVQTDNGDIIVAMYGQFVQDKNKVDYFENYDFYQYRTWCIISQDQGKTFRFLSVIADAMTFHIDSLAEGFCETDLLNAGKGHLIAALRTEGHDMHSPVYISNSYDDGNTWEAPYEAAPYGVLPKLTLMDNGILVMSSGRYHSFLVFSEDMGRSWSEPYILKNNDLLWDRGPSGYTTIFSSSSDTVTVIYDDPENRDPIVDDPLDRRILYVEKIKLII